MSLGEAAEADLAVIGFCGAGHRYDIPLQNMIDLMGRFAQLEDALARHAYCPSCGALASRVEILRPGADNPP